MEEGRRRSKSTYELRRGKEGRKWVVFEIESGGMARGWEVKRERRRGWRSKRCFEQERRGRRSSCCGRRGGLAVRMVLQRAVKTGSESTANSDRKFRAEEKRVRK